MVGPEGFDPTAGLEGEEAAAGEEALNAVVEHPVRVELVGPRPTYPVGTDAALEVRVLCNEGCDLAGGYVLIIDGNGSTVAEAQLGGLVDGKEGNTTGSFAVPIPEEPDDYLWQACFEPAEDRPPADSEGPSGTQAAADAEGPGLEGHTTPDADADDAETVPAHASTCIDFPFAAVPHTTGLSLWIARQPVFAGAEFQLDIGASCVSGCSFLGQTVAVYAGEDLLCRVGLQEPQAAIPGLYRAVACLKAPAEVGRYTLTCRIAPEGLEAPHAPAAQSLTYATALEPQTRLRIAVIDDYSEKPLDEAHVLLRTEGGYLYHLDVDPQGQAEIELPFGEYHVDTICKRYRDSFETVTLEAGQDTQELTIALNYDPGMISL